MQPEEQSLNNNKCFQMSKKKKKKAKELFQIKRDKREMTI